LPADSPAETAAPEPASVQRLPWDFKESFPPPLPEALNAGILRDQDTKPENMRALHDEQARQLLATLRDLNFIGDARRRLFDPRTGEVANNPEEKKRLRSQLFGEVQRLSLWWQTLIDTYARAFGEEAADAFAMAVRARNAGIEVIAEPRDASPLSSPETSASPAPSQVAPPERQALVVERKPDPRPAPHPRTVRARFPLPTPLRAAINAGSFGRDENGVVRPSAAQIRSLTLQHSETLIELLGAIAHASRSSLADEVGRLNEAFRSGVAAYAKDFGPTAAKQLEAFCRRQAHLRSTDAGDGPHS
jgi:hypothetical protein